MNKTIVRRMAALHDMMILGQLSRNEPWTQFLGCQGAMHDSRTIYALVNKGLCCVTESFPYGWTKTVKVTEEGIEYVTCRRKQDLK